MYFLANSVLFSQMEENSLSTTMPARKAKHKSRKGPVVAKETSHTRLTILTDDEVRQHVTAQYIHGPGGTLRTAIAKRQQQQQKRQQQQDEENLEQLKRLDQHPALVLNADYQVRHLALFL